ncbi:hypothetical protein CKO36_13320 [Rhabdochromatium marinum]|nr:hypothetical protein [Rhabdochromatium marinum]
MLRVWLEAWRSVPVGSMPSDRRLFARRIGCKPAFLDAHAEILLRGWQRHSDGLLYHGFITALVLKMLDTRRSSAAKVRAWRERKKADKTTKQGDVTGYNGACNRNVPVSNRQEQEQEEKPLTPFRHPAEGHAEARQARPLAPPHLGQSQRLGRVEQHRRKMGKPLTDLARTKAANRLQDLSPEEQQQCIDTSIQARWSGLFPEKTKHANSNDAKHERRKRAFDKTIARARAHFDEMD